MISETDIIRPAFWRFRHVKVTERNGKGQMKTVEKLIAPRWPDVLGCSIGGFALGILALLLATHH